MDTLDQTLRDIVTIAMPKPPLRFPSAVDPLDTAEETLRVICNRLIDEIAAAANRHDDVALTLLEVRAKRMAAAFEAVESLATKYATDYRLTELIGRT